MVVISLFSLIGSAISCVLLLFLLERTTAAIFAAHYVVPACFQPSPEAKRASTEQ